MTHVENPRTKCWKITVPNRWRETFRDESFWPLGWSHRPWANRHSGNEKEPAKKVAANSQIAVVEDESSSPRSSQASM